MVAEIVENFLVVVLRGLGRRLGLRGRDERKDLAVAVAAVVDIWVGEERMSLEIENEAAIGRSVRVWLTKEVFEFEWF
jgi:hypothetical protein